ncbi:MAG: hypothetical protein J7L34_01510 [Thermotogaceae bacterium]|nr:hypothetical protein [Thermotogaceae bacterium]
MKVAAALMLIFSTIMFPGYFTYSVGVAVTGVVLPYLGVYYNMDNFQLAGSLRFICGPNEENPDEWNFLFSAELGGGYYITEQLYFGANFSMLVVTPYQYEQLYMAGVEAKYGIPLNKGRINLSLEGNIILPISAGKRAWEEGRNMNPWIPVPLLKGEYEF